MKLKIQKRLASECLKCSEKKIAFDTSRLEDIKEAITKAVIRSLISEGVISKKNKNQSSRTGARKIKVQKRKGRHKKQGSKKGKKTARLPKKKAWMEKVRKQREFLKTLRDKKIITSSIYQILYKKSKGGFFRSKRHIKLYIEEQRLVKEKEK